MENFSYTYDAFISYRHFSLDKEVVNKLQKLLERRRFIFLENGEQKKRSLKVFVDRSELPTSGNLGEDIRSALEQSRFLIIVYSRETKESRWCMEELRYFRSLHGNTNQNILPLLIDGEPDDVFPEEIRWESGRVQNQQGEWEDVQIYAEPLGADIRGKNRKDMFRKLKTEYMRIQAPILNCGFDDLYQRKKRRNRRTLTALAAGVTAVSVGFGVYNAYMLRRITIERQGMLQSEANRLAEHSQTQRGENDILLATLLAQEALRLDQTDKEEFSRAEVALRSAVLQSKYHNEKKYVDIAARITFNLDQWVIQNSYAGGTKITVTDFEYTYLIDTANGDLLFSCPGEEVYFNEDASRCVQIMHDYGKKSVTITGFSTDTGEQYFSFHKNYESEDINFGEDNYFGIFDEETDDCYIGVHSYEEGKNKTDFLAKYTVNGDEANKFTTPERILDKWADMAYLHSYSNQEYVNVSLNLDYTREDMEEQEVDEREQKIIQYYESLGWTSLGAVHAQEGKALLIPAYPTRGSIADTKTFVYSLDSFTYRTSFEGTAFLDKNSGLLYRKDGEKLDILTFHPENVNIKKKLTQQYEYMSVDGEKVLKLDSDDARESGRGTLSVHSAEKLNTPLLETSVYVSPFDNGEILYYFTPQMDKVFLADENLALQLWEVGKGCVLEFKLESGRKLDAVAMDDAGEQLAVAYTNSSSESPEDDKSYVELRSAKDGKVTDVFEINQWLDSGACTHLEILDSLLLISTTSQSLLIDLTGNAEPRILKGGNQTHPTRRFLTDDGLLFCTLDFNTKYCLEDIFDIKTGASISPVDGARAYSYDSDSGYLAYQMMNNGENSNLVHVARRSEGGAFEEAYSFRPKGVDMQMLPSGDGMEGKYLLLAGHEECEVYNLETGEQILGIQESSFQLHNGMLRSMQDDGSEHIVSLNPSENQETLLEQANKMLKGNYAVRVLNEFEKERFWVQDISD